MTVGCVTWVLHDSPVTGNDRLVLIVLADHAEDDGSDCYPSIDLIARKARISRPTVLRAIARLEAGGALLVRRPPKEERGRGRFNRYHITKGRDPLALAAEVGWDPPQLDPETFKEWSHSDTIPDPKNGPERSHQGSETVTPALTRTTTEPLNLSTFSEPSAKATAQRRLSLLPESFALTPEMRAWAREHTPGVDIGEELEQFRDHWQGKGERRADWVATWRTWMRNAQRWHRGGLASVDDLVAPE